MAMLSEEAMGAGGGALTGATTGMTFGPVGALAGAAIGAGTSLYGSMSAKKEQKAQQKRAEEATQSIPGRRKASRAWDAFREAMQTRFQSMASLSQAAMDWAQLMR